MNAMLQTVATFQKIIRKNIKYLRKWCIGRCALIYFEFEALKFFNPCRRLMIPCHKFMSLVLIFCFLFFTAKADFEFSSQSKSIILSIVFNLSVTISSLTSSRILPEPIKPPVWKELCITLFYWLHWHWFFYLQIGFVAFVLGFDSFGSDSN